MVREIKKHTTLVLLSFFFVNPNLSGQQNFSDDPLLAHFVTDDFDRFWTAFYAVDTAVTNPFQAYIKNASHGLKPLAQYLDADLLLQTVKQRKEDYLKSKDVLQDLDRKKKRIKAIYTAMKYWYPMSKFPPVYFVVYNFSSGGTVSENGLLIGSELLHDLEGLPGLVAHELIHFQQNFKGNPILLNQAIIEGSADFIGELISGESMNSVAFAYGDRNEDKLCREFIEIMNGEDYSDWLYGTSGKDDRPNDLGYWIGYKITEAYFNKQDDKHLAIEDILNVKDAFQFLKESGYLNQFLTGKK